MQDLSISSLLYRNRNNFSFISRKVELFKYQAHSSLLTDKLGQILNLKYSRNSKHIKKSKNKQAVLLR